MTANSDKPVLALVDGAKKPPRKIKPNQDASKTNDNASKTKAFGKYCIINGAFNQIKKLHNDDEEINIILCNFTCKIIEEIKTDDDLADSSFLRIQGTRKGGGALPLVDVPFKDFFSTQSSWHNEAWGTKVLINPGVSIKANLQAAIHTFSLVDGDIPVRTIFKYTGWKKINEQWHYLTNFGAITAGGLAGGVDVDLGSGHMSRYQLPEPLTGDALNLAAGCALDFLKICPDKLHIGAALLAAVARAPLGECYGIDFAVWLHGLTGSRKSSLAGVALDFFGNFGEGRLTKFPGNWSDSVNDAEAKSYQAKDSIFILDDYKPSVSLTEASKLHAMAERIVRNTGNLAGRGRRGSAMEAKAAPYNRSMLLVTGEELPKGQSLLARLLVLEISNNDVDVELLTEIQVNRDSGLLKGLMANYLQWLAPQIDQLKKDFPTLMRIHLDFASKSGIQSHTRAPGIYANLMTGFEVFLNFLLATEQINDLQQQRLLSDMRENLQQAFSEQGEYQADQDEAKRFLSLLRAALSSGNAHIACRLNQGPPQLRPHGWGWRDVGDTLTEDINGNPVAHKNMTPNGDCVGWYCGAVDGKYPELWLQQDAVFKIVAYSD